MTKRADKLLSSLAKYVEDVKPYHTKLREFLSEVTLEDKFNVRVTSSHSVELHMQNVWTESDIGGTTMSKIAEGNDSDLSFRIPAAVFPRFKESENDTRLSMTKDDQIEVDAQITEITYEVTSASISNQTCTYGFKVNLVIDSDDHAIFEFDGARAVVNGISLAAIVDDTSVTAIGGSGEFTFSQSDLDEIASMGKDSNDAKIVAMYALSKSSHDIIVRFTETGRYPAQYHHGSKVEVDGVRQVYGTDYVVTDSRNFIQFMPGSKPTSGSSIDVTLMLTDKLFISYHDPLSFIGDVDAFTVTVDDTFPDRYALPLVQLDQQGKHKPILRVDKVYPGTPHGTKYELKATGFYQMSVQRVSPTVGPISYASFKTPFDNGEIALTIDRKWYKYSFVADRNTYDSYDFGLFEGFSYNGSIDETEYLVDLGLEAEHGSMDDHVHLKPFGKIKKKQDNQGDYYSFELDAIPARGSYFELRVEQNDLLNPRLGISLGERVVISDFDRVQVVGGPPVSQPLPEPTPIDGCTPFNWSWVPTLADRDTYYNDPNNDAAMMVLNFGGYPASWTGAGVLQSLINDRSGTINVDGAVNDGSTIDSWSQTAMFEISDPATYARYLAVGGRFDGTDNPGPGKFEYPGVASYDAWFKSEIIARNFGKPVLCEIYYTKNSNSSKRFADYTMFGDWGSAGVPEINSSSPGAHIKKYVFGILKQSADSTSPQESDFVMGCVVDGTSGSHTIKVIKNGTVVVSDDVGSAATYLYGWVDFITEVPSSYLGSNTSNCDMFGVVTDDGHVDFRSTWPDSSGATDGLFDTCQVKMVFYVDMDNGLGDGVEDVDNPFLWHPGSMYTIPIGV